MTALHLGTLRAAVADGTPIDDIRAQKAGMVKTIHKILMIHLGTPPTSFDWQYTTANKEYHVMQGLTPQSFYTDVVRSHTVTRHVKSFLLPSLSSKA